MDMLGDLTAPPADSIDGSRGEVRMGRGQRVREGRDGATSVPPHF